MKLLQLNVTANWGSTGKIAEGIGLVAMNRGWESYIAYGRMMNPSQSQLIKVGNMFDVYAHYARNRFLDGEGLGSKRATKALVRKIDELLPDIIHLHNIHDHWLNYPILFEYLAGINTPVIWTFHDCWAFTGGCTHFENNGCYKWETSDCQGICPLGFYSAASNFAIRHDALSKLGNRLHIICVSEWLASYVRRSFLAEAGASINVVNNGIDVHGVFRPTGVKQKMILGVSNIWPKSKGLDDFIKLRNLLPNDVKICIIGLSQNQIKSLPAGIDGMTRTSSATELAELYSKTSAFVNPTYNDSFPTVNLEALACGTPVITYRTGGSPEAIDDRTGIVVEQGDIHGLAVAINQVISNPDNFSVKKCRDRAVRNFNQDIQFNKYIDIYEQILSKN